MLVGDLRFLDFFFNDVFVGDDPAEVDRIERWGGLIAPLLTPFLLIFCDELFSLTELPLIIGNCSELGGSSSFFPSLALRRLLVSRGDMKVMCRPPGVAVSAS